MFQEKKSVILKMTPKEVNDCVRSGSILFGVLSILVIIIVLICLDRGHLTSSESGESGSTSPTTTNFTTTTTAPTTTSTSAKNAALRLQDEEKAEKARQFMSRIGFRNLLMLASLKKQFNDTGLFSSIR